MGRDIVVYEPNMNSSPHSEINVGLLSVFELIGRKTLNSFMVIKDILIILRLKKHRKLEFN